MTPMMKETDMDGATMIISLTAVSFASLLWFAVQQIRSVKDD
jgi:hypothetical protein